MFKKIFIAALSFALAFSVTAQETKYSSFVILGGRYVVEPKEDIVENNFNLFASCIFLKGNFNKHLDFLIKLNVLPSPHMADAYLNVKLNKYINFSVGQIEVPYTIQTNLSPVAIDGGYDPVILKLAGNNDVCGVGTNMRDVGISLSGSAFEREFNGKKFDFLKYSVGLVNGYDLNKADNDNKKNIAAKIDIFPYNDVLDLSASVYKGTFTKGDIVNGARDRFAVGIKHFGYRLNILSEHIWGKTGCFPIENGKDYFLSRGGYLSVGYSFYFKPLIDGAAKQKLMPMVKYDYLRENVELDDFAGTACLGVRYMPFADVYVDGYYRVLTNNITDTIRNTFTLECTIKF